MTESEDRPLRQIESGTVVAMRSSDFERFTYAAHFVMLPGSSLTVLPDEATSDDLVQAAAVMQTGRATPQPVEPVTPRTL